MTLEFFILELFWKLTYPLFRIVCMSASQMSQNNLKTMNFLEECKVHKLIFKRYFSKTLLSHEEKTVDSKIFLFTV